MADLNTGRKEKAHNVEFAKGGNTHMFGPQKTGEQKPGVTETDSGSGSGDKFASGGKGKMFGFSGSQPAQAGITSAR
jgi:hypothetical protein